MPTTQRKYLDLIFDRPPGPKAPRFIEAVSRNGRSVKAGEWHERADGKWILRIPKQ